MLESVQRKFTKRIPSLSPLCYNERLAKLDLETLETRRLRFDLINYYKIIKGMSPLNPEEYFLIYRPPSSSRSVMLYLQHPIKSSSKLLTSFFYINIKAWNSLPCELKSLSSLTSFKSAIKKVDLTGFLKLVL